MPKLAKKKIFLDYASITPVDQGVASMMLKVQKQFWANPSSLHYFGERAKDVLIETRLNIAKMLQCRASEIVFTGSGTESLNLAILGTVAQAKTKIKTPHLIISSLEHPAVLEPVKSLLKQNQIEVTFVTPNEEGVINPESIKRELKNNTVLVAVQHSNNEIGVIQPIAKIASVIKNFRQESNHPYPYFLVDASQSFLFENISLERLQADLLVLDGIKVYGPRGIGLLVVRHNVLLDPIIFGGGQEFGLRSGTENLPAIAGLGQAFKTAIVLREKESKRLKIIRDYAVQKILKEIPNTSLNGSLENRLPNNLNICFSHSAKATWDESVLDSEFLVIKLDVLGFAVSAASACHHLNLENGSYVIESLGKKDCAGSSLRITLGRETKKSDLDQLIIALKKIVC
jgi:cysteine desulfurase